MEIIGEQPLDEAEARLLREAYGRLRDWQQDCRPYHESAEKCRRIYRLDDPEQDVPGTPPTRKTIQLQTLKSTINNCVADQMDNMPEALMLPERPEVEQLASEMTDVVRFILDQNGYETFHRRRVEDFFISGTAVTQIGWDADMDNGDGNVAVARVPMERMVWDPEAEDVQDARAVIKLSWHPLSWFAEHYPDKAPYIHDENNQHNHLGVPESAQALIAPSEGRAMLMEYWYRRYQNKRYTINVAFLAGGAAGIRGPAFPAGIAPDEAGRIRAAGGGRQAGQGGEHFRGHRHAPAPRGTGPEARGRGAPAARKAGARQGQRGALQIL